MPGNPITRRLDRLYQQWHAFVDDAPTRVLRWCVRADETRMIEAFVAVETSEGGQLPALFLRLVVPFEAPHTYAGALARELLDQVEHTAKDDPALTGFVVPRPRTENDGIPSLVELAAALAEHLRARGVPLEQLVLAIFPPPLADVAGWNRFVGRLAHALATSEVRAIVVDDRSATVLGPAVAAAPTRIHTAVADLDMPAAIVEISARAGDLDTPPGRFRHAYTKMLLAVADGDLDGARARASEAEAIAGAAGWWHLLVAVRFCLGTGELDGARATAAIQWFRRAEQAIDGRTTTTGADDEETLARSLRLKCRLGLGAACYFAAAYERAAEVYAGAADLAKELSDDRAELDARRMQSHCLERAGRPDDAWNAGVQGIGVGARIPAEDRKTSTLAHLGAALVELTKTPRLGHGRKAIESHMQSLLGADWQPRATGS